MAISLLDVMGGYAWAQGNDKNAHKMPAATTIKAKKPLTKINRIAPQIPGANRNQKNKIFLEKADKLIADERISTDYQILRGNVEFSKSGTRMFCDSAYFYDATNSLDAFGHVKMNQGDTLFVYADVLYYNGQDEIAQLRYNVKMENRDVTLFTDSLDYDMVENLGYYFEGGKIIDAKNELSSVYGQYEPDTKNAQFLFDVELVNDDYVLHTDTLHYNTNTHIADIVGTTTIVSDSSIIYSNKGWYNTDADKATLYNRSLIVGKDGQKLVGDTVYYDRATGYGEAFGNMILTDSVRSTILDGDYGYHNEKTNVSFATKRARAREFSRKDTLYLHADTIRTYLDADSMRVMVANPGVRFYRVNIQGICDSMSIVERDSMLNMYNHALVWSDNRQISGNEINVHMNDSTVDYALLPNYGMMAEHVGETYFNQLAGKEMKAYFIEEELRRLDVSGNVQLIMYPMEDDSTYNKLVDAESSYMTVLLKPKQQIDKITMWPEVSGNVTPLYLSKKSQYYLKGFGWYDALRPKDPDDIFVYPEEMRQLLNSEEIRRRSVKKQ
ncbi:MAG: OstA-like protein [Muribaculaceae bacterium]